MPIYLQPQIKRADYKAFKHVMPDDTNLPDTYDEWLKEQAKEHSKIIKAGNLAREIPVEPDEFFRYCRANAMKTDSSALGTFTAAKAMKDKLLAPTIPATAKRLIDIGR